MHVYYTHQSAARLAEGYWIFRTHHDAKLPTWPSVGCYRTTVLFAVPFSHCSTFRMHLRSTLVVDTPYLGLKKSITFLLVCVCWDMIVSLFSYLIEACWPARVLGSMVCTEIIPSQTRSLKRHGVSDVAARSSRTEANGGVANEICIWGNRDQVHVPLVRCSQ